MKENGPLKKNLLLPVTPEDYLDAAKAAMRFIMTRVRTDAPEGHYWTLEDAQTGHERYYDEICMYSGAAGIVCYLLSLYQVTSDEAYLAEARQGGAYLMYRWYHQRELKKNFSKYAFSTGYSGAAYALTALYKLTGDEEYKACVESIIDGMKADAQPGEGGQGYTWSTYPGIVGNAGTVLFLLYAADVYDRPDWRSFAVEAGRIFLGKGRSMGDGKIVYSGVDPTYFHASPDYVDPNFPMGTGGIGFTLLRLYEASGDPVFRDAVNGVAEYMEDAATKTADAALLPHALPDRPDLYYLGYCHGPAGTTRFFYKMYTMTGDRAYLDWALRFANGTTKAGAPEIHSPGYWNTYNICCGTAGIENMYLGLYAATGRDDLRKMALRCGRVLLGAADWTEEADGTHACWNFALDRVAPKVITSPIGLFDGAAGIGLMLLELYQCETGTFQVSRAIDDPFPEKFIF